MERKNLTVVRFEFHGHSASREFVANYIYGKQKRTKTRKEKAEARKAQTRELHPTRPSCNHTITQKQLKSINTLIPAQHFPLIENSATMTRQRRGESRSGECPGNAISPPSGWAG